VGEKTNILYGEILLTVSTEDARSSALADPDILTTTTRVREHLGMMLRQKETWQGMDYAL
jgi:hypothetical protein